MLRASADTKTWLCPFPNCDGREFKHKEARPIFGRLHIACHALLGHVLQGEKASDTSVYCALCGSVASGCTVELRTGSKSDRPLVRFRNGKTFANWSQKMLKEVKNTPRVVKCHACQQWQWNFNLQKHYACEHPKVQMNSTDKKICKEIVKPFAEKHLAKVSGATTYAKQGKKTPKTKRKKRKPKVKTTNRVKKSQSNGVSVLDMLVNAPPKKKRKMNKTPTGSLKKKQANPALPKKQPKPALPKKRPKPMPKASSDSESELDAPPQKRRKLAPPRKRKRQTDSDSDFNLDEEVGLSSSDDENNIFAQTRRKRKLIPPTPLETNKPDGWESILSQLSGCDDSDLE